MGKQLFRIEPIKHKKLKALFFLKAHKNVPEGALSEDAMKDLELTLKQLANRAKVSSGWRLEFEEVSAVNIKTKGEE